jgi:hypothetical protein
MAKHIATWASNTTMSHNAQGLDKQIMKANAKIRK